MKSNSRFLSILVIALVVFVVVQFGSKFFVGNALNNSPILLLAVWLVPFAVILLVFIVGALAIPATRARSLTEDRPADTVINSRISRSLRATVFAASDRTQPPHFLSLTGVTLVANDAGLDAWGGAVNLRRFGTIPWSEVSGITVLEPSGSLATTPMIWLHFDDEREAVTFPVAGTVGLAATPLAGPQLAAVVAALEAHRRRARPLD